MAIRADEVDLGRDRDLVERYQAGDPSAFDDLYERYFDRLRAYCHRRVGDSHEAEELAQEAFMRALRALPRFAGERRFYPWMTVIAQRLCVDHHRRRGRIHLVSDVDPGGVVDGEHDHLFLDVDVGHLSLAMERLAPRHREVLKLREQEGWSYQQIADHLDVPMTTVEALLHRARKALRREFNAVAGDSRWIALPVVGWLVRTAGSIRDKIGDRIPELSSLTAPVAAGAMTIALAVGPVVSGGGDGGKAVATVGGSTPASVVVDPATADPAAAPAAPTPSPSADTPEVASTTPTSAAPAPAAVGPAEVFVGPGGAAAAEEASEDMDTRADVGSAWLAADIEQITDNLPIPPTPLGVDQ